MQMPNRLLTIGVNPVSFDPMKQSSNKLLAILLALLVGLVPLQGAMAGVVDSFDQGEGGHQMADRQDDSLAMVNYVLAQDCEHCKVDAGCSNGDGCSSGGCVSCVLELLPVVSSLTHQSAVSVRFRTADGFVRHSSSSLFRPPRA